ncbi:MAG: electron transfer flavoprotein subunit alpha/FixB family protein [Coriobacteriales bacterium]
MSNASFAQLGWVVVCDTARMGALITQAREVCAEVVAVVAGGADLVSQAAAAGFDKVVVVSIEGDTAVEAAAPAVSALAVQDKPQLILSNTNPAARVLLGAAAAAGGAKVLDHVVALRQEGEGAVARCEVAAGIAFEEYELSGPFAGVFVGADAPVPGGEAPVESCGSAQGAVRVVETVPSEQTGLADASKVVGVGMGVKEDVFEQVKAFAAEIGAELACSLPVCDDRHWLPSSRVLGSSHNQCAPDLYIALGISGSPNHVSGVRDTKVVVAVNTDPEAPIFKTADYGIAADVAEVLPVLAAALK